MNSIIGKTIIYRERNKSEKLEGTIIDKIFASEEVRNEIASRVGGLCVVTNIFLSLNM